MPPASFCNGLSPEHTNVPPDPWRGSRQATSRQMTSPLAGRRPPGFLRSGVAWRCRLVDPHRDDRSPQWIYPGLTDPGTSLSRIRVELRLETTLLDGPAVWAPLPNESARRTSLALGTPSELEPKLEPRNRAAFRATSRKTT